MCVRFRPRSPSRRHVYDDVKARSECAIPIGKKLERKFPPISSPFLYIVTLYCIALRQRATEDEGGGGSTDVDDFDDDGSSLSSTSEEEEKKKRLLDADDFDDDVRVATFDGRFRVQGVDEEERTKAREG